MNNEIDIDQTQKLQETIRFLAEEFNRVCENHHLCYSMVGGTMLGAIRHKGFIPWDDDFDVAMPRKDYDQFVEICKKELDKSRFYLQTENGERLYPYPFAKLQLCGTELLEEFSMNVPVQHGIFLDVFPYDNLPQGHIRKKIYLFRNHLMKNIIWNKCGYGTKQHKKQLRNKVCRVLGKFHSIETWKSLRYQCITKYNNQYTQELFISEYPREIIPASWFDSIIKYKFEDTKFNGFKDYDDYLTNVFGNYMKLPPVEKRVQHSCYQINYGIYDTLR